MSKELDPRFSRLEVDDGEPPKKPTRLNLGARVKDLVTGFEGSAYSRTEFMYGCNRIGVEPLTLKDGKPQEVQYFDEQRIEVVEDAPEFEYPPEKFKKGSKVRDTVTGFSGVAIGRTVDRYGLARTHIEPTTLHEGKPIDSYAFHEARIELVEVKEPPVSKTSEARAGGPQNDRVQVR